MFEEINSGNDYENLKLHIESARLLNRLNMNELTNEEQKVVDFLSYELCRDQIEKDVLFVSDYFSLMIKFLLNQMTSDELHEFQRNAGEFEKRFKQLSAKYPAEFETLDGYLSVLNKHIKEMAAFYDIAKKRDEKFIENFIDKEEKETKVMITGGFHTYGVAEKLKKAGISYSIISPRVTSYTEEDRKKYYSLLRNKVSVDLTKLLHELALGSFLMNNSVRNMIKVRALISFLKHEVKNEKNLISKVNQFIRKSNMVMPQLNEGFQYGGQYLFGIELEGDKTYFAFRNGEVREISREKYLKLAGERNC